MDGRSFVTLLRRTSPRPLEWRRQFLVESKGNYSPSRPRFHAVRTANSLYLDYETGERELYNLTTDPHQLKSVHRSRPKVVSRMKRELEVLKDCGGEECYRAEMAR